MNVRTAMASVTAVLLMSALAGCTTTIAGTPGPPPNVSGGGDFGTGSGTPTTDPTDDPTSESPTDDPTSDSPTEDPTDTDTPSEDGSIEQLCADMQDTIDGPDLGESGYQALIGLDILGWGLANGDSEPFDTVDAATTKSCPDVRTAVLAKTNTPDLKSIYS